MIRPERDDRRLAREVFARTRVAPAPDLSRRARARVAAERRRRARSDGGWQLVLAGGVLALAMTAGLLADEGVLQWPAWGSPAPAPAPQTATLGSGGPAAPTFLVPPAGGGPGPLRRVDWTGRATGSLAVPDGGTVAGVSADGALVAVRTGRGGGADVLDRNGRVVARLAAFDAWSGDGAHVACSLVAGAAGLEIATSDLRDLARPASATAAVAGLDGGGAGWTLGGCSAMANRLVALHEVAPPVVDEAALIDPRTGRVLVRVRYDDGLPPVAPALSPDARYLAENDPERSVAGIRDLVVGDVVGHVTGLVTAFSGDGRLVVTDTELGAPAPESRVALVDWRWHRTVWAGAGHGTALAASPGGEALALAVAAGPQAPRQALLVDGGRALELDPAPPSGSSMGA